MAQPLVQPKEFIPVENNNQTSVDNAISLLHIDFWKGKDGKPPQSRRTWERLDNELKRLKDYAGADLTIDLLVAVAEKETKAGTRSRLESCKVFKRLGKLAGLKANELEKLDEIKGALEVYQKGIATASKKGDLMPLKEMQKVQK